MGNSESALGAASCQQSLYSCNDIGIDNVPAYAFSAPRGVSGMFGRGSSTAPAKPNAADAAASGSCLQYCIPTQNSLAIKSTLKAKIGYCCTQGARRTHHALPSRAPRCRSSRLRASAPTPFARAGFNDFQGSIHELVPGMSDIAIWQYDKGDSSF